MLRNSINAISNGCQKNTGLGSESILSFFLNHAVLGLGLFRVRVSVHPSPPFPQTWLGSEP